MLVELESVTKLYNRGRASEVTALRGVTLRIGEGEMLCLRGASGSGKSTLLAVMGCIIQPTSGGVIIAGRPISRLPDRFMTLHRRRVVGFIFQHFNVLPALTVRENISLPLLPLGLPHARVRERVDELMGRFSISHRARFPAGRISGGELQRVAIARALVGDPPLILADEPTAHLDSRLGREFMDLMAALNAAGKTIVIASHDPAVTAHGGIGRIVDLRDGEIRAP